jgi:hypothetical protein
MKTPAGIQTDRNCLRWPAKKEDLNSEQWGDYNSARLTSFQPKRSRQEDYRDIQEWYYISASCCIRSHSLYCRPSLMQLCFIGPIRPIHRISQSFLKLMLLEANCCSLKTIKTIKTPLKMLKLHLRLLQHVSTQLGHPQVTHCYKALFTALLSWIHERRNLF